MNPPIRPRSAIAISALAVVVGAGTAGIYTLTTPSEPPAPAIHYPPAAAAPIPPAPAHNTSTPPEASALTPPAETSEPAPSEPVTPEPDSPAPDSPETETSSTTPAEETSTRKTTSEQAPDAPENALLDMVNEARETAGCDPVTLDSKLTEAATEHSEDMAERDYFSHISPEGASFVERTLETGYLSPGAENLAQGQRSAEQVMDEWMDSEGHRQNILNCSLTTMGLGLETDGWYWTQVFGR